MCVERLRGVCIYLDVVSVGVIINIMFVVVLVEGKMIIENVVKEFEIIDVVILFISMGVKIKGVGINVI